MHSTKNIPATKLRAKPSAKRAHAGNEISKFRICVASNSTRSTHRFIDAEHGHNKKPVRALVKITQKEKHHENLDT